MTEVVSENEQKNPPDAIEIRWRMELAAKYASHTEATLVEAAREINEALEVVRQGSSDNQF